MATADAMTLVKVLHQLLTFADAMSPVKGLHKAVTIEHAISPLKELHEPVTLAFISVTYLCFENKLVWKLTPSHLPSKDIFIIFMTIVKVISFGPPLLLCFSISIVVYYQKKNYNSGHQKIPLLVGGSFSRYGHYPIPPPIIGHLAYDQ